MSSKKNHNKLQAVFTEIFYRSTDEDWEESINPRLGHGTQFLLTCHVFLIIQKKFNIDFWKWYHINPHFSYHIHPDPNPYVYVRGVPHYQPSWEVGDRYDKPAWSIKSDLKYYHQAINEYGGNPTFEMIFQPVQPHNPNEHDFKQDTPYWNMYTIFDPNLWVSSSREWRVQYLNILFDTNYSLEDDQNDDMDDELEKVWYDNVEADTLSYFDMLNYLMIWIDRWAHDIVDPSMIPKESKQHIMEYGGIKEYHVETDLDNRTKLLTEESEQPECLTPVWELFKMCEDEILNNEFFEVDECYNVKIKKHEDEVYYPHSKFVKYQKATKIQSVWRGYIQRK